MMSELMTEKTDDKENIKLLKRLYNRIGNRLWPTDVTSIAKILAEELVPFFEKYEELQKEYDLMSEECKRYSDELEEIRFGKKEKDENNV